MSHGILCEFLKCHRACVSTGARAFSNSCALDQAHAWANDQDVHALCIARDDSGPCMPVCLASTVESSRKWWFAGRTHPC